MARRALDWEAIQDKIKGKKVYLKVHESEGNVIYAFADPELVGLRLRDKERKLNFFVNPTFYKEGGTLIPLENALEMLLKHPNCNIVGRLAYYAGMAGIVFPQTILWIKDEEKSIRVPHLLLIRT